MTAEKKDKEMAGYMPPPPPAGKKVLVSVRGVDKVFVKGDEKVYALSEIGRAHV